MNWPLRPACFRVCACILVMQWLQSPQAHAQSPQPIDDLRTAAQVDTFLQRHISNRLQTFSLTPQRPLITTVTLRSGDKTFGEKAFERVDFDHNGYKDLVINGYSTFADFRNCRQTAFIVLAFPNDSFRVKILNYSFLSYFAAKTVRLDGRPCIVTLNISSEKEDSVTTVRHRRLDTLMYVYDDFIDRSKFQSTKIDSIHFKLLTDLADPDELTLQGNRLRMQSYRHYKNPPTDLEIPGIFQATLDADTFTRITNILRYLDIHRLQEHYQGLAITGVSAQLGIWYDHGKRLAIDDNGFAGTYSLKALERIFMGLRSSQHWNRKTILKAAP